MDYLIKDPPVIWGSLYLSIVLLFVMAFLVYAAVHHRRLLPRVRDPEELYARLQGDWEKSSDGVDVDANDYSEFSDRRVAKVEYAGQIVGVSAGVIWLGDVVGME